MQNQNALIDAAGKDFRQLNREIKACGQKNITLTNCLGQRFIAAGMTGKNLHINGIPGNALGCYLSDSVITVNGNAQDQLGDTMDNGTIIIHGDAGDCAGYAMRGGSIFIKGNTGYRTGIHMKAYEENIPVLIIGGAAGSFLGEYQAGGIIIVLGLTEPERFTGAFCAIGMHGGRIYLRTADAGLPPSDKLNINIAAEEDIALIKPYLSRFAAYFGGDADELAAGPFTLVTPNTRNPYKTLYTYS